MSVTDPRVVREHWRGGGDVVELVGATALIAARLLPQKIRRVLTSRVEAPKVSERTESDACQCRYWLNDRLRKVQSSRLRVLADKCLNCECV